MSLGVIVNSIVVLVGGFIGAFFGHKLPKNILYELPAIFGLSAVAMGVTLIVRLQNLTPVILAIILGTIIGEILQLDYRLSNLIGNVVKKIDKGHDEYTDTLVTIIILFCFSGTGIFGVLIEGFTGDSSIMITKSVLDFFTAIIFGATTGYLVALISIPQFIINILLYLSAGIIVPILNDGVLLDFKACGGIVTLAVGFKLANMRNFKPLNILPSIVLVIPLSYLWQNLL